MIVCLCVCRMTEHLIDSLISFLQALPWWGVLLFAFANSYIENVFPPSPSDVLLVFIGSMVGLGLVDFGSALVWSTLGSILGFMTMFRIGQSVDRGLVESGKYRFIPVDAIHKVEQWFRKWGYVVIVVNRFLSGTRAVIAFLAGMSEMRFTPSIIYCGLSALVWNALILAAGMALGKNWRDLDRYLTEYSTAVGILLVLIAVAYAVRWILQRRSQGPANSTDPQA